MKEYRKKIRYIEIGNESGFALIIVMLVLLMMTILGLNAIMTSSTEVQISGNERTSAKTLSIAEAGLNHGMRTLRGQNFDQILAGVDATTHLATLVSASFDGGSYAVYVRNNYPDPGVAGADAGDAAANGYTATPNKYNSDSDDLIIIRSVGTFKGITKTVEGEVRRLAADFPISGGLGISGRLEEIDIDGNSFRITGQNTTPAGWTPTTTCGAHSGIALGDCYSRCVIVGCPNTDPCYDAHANDHALNAQELNNITNSNNQTGAAATDVVTTLQNQTATIQAKVDQIMPLADRTFNVNEDTTMQNINWGTYANPQITVVNFTNQTDEKELRIEGTSTGYGILIVNSNNSVKGGELELRGNFTWYGIIIFTNFSEAEFGSGGNINIYGGILLANNATTNASPTDNELEIKGNTQIFYSCATEQRAKNYTALTMNSWHEVAS